MATELLGPVDWNEWRRAADGELKTETRPAMQKVAVVHAVVHENGGRPREIGEAERIAFMVLGLGHTTTKKETKIVRMALREIEQAVLTAQQDIDYLD